MIDTQKCIDTAVRYAMRKYGRFVESADLDSVCWEYFTKHSSRMFEWECLADEGKERLALWQINRELNRALDNYCRREKAEKSRYEKDDEVFYSLKAIGEMLPFVLSGDNRPPIGEAPEVRTKRDPAFRGDWFAGFMDVDGAWYTTPLTVTERDVLVRLYLDGEGQAGVAESLGLTQQAIGKAHKRALGKLLEALGGPHPGLGCPYDCECHEGRLRARPWAHKNDDGMWQMLG